MLHAFTSKKILRREFKYHSYARSIYPTSPYSFMALLCTILIFWGCFGLATGKILEAPLLQPRAVPGIKPSAVLFVDRYGRLATTQLVTHPKSQAYGVLSQDHQNDLEGAGVGIRSLHRPAVILHFPSHILALFVFFCHAKELRDSVCVAVFLLAHVDLAVNKIFHYLGIPPFQRSAGSLSFVLVRQTPYCGQSMPTLSSTLHYTPGILIHPGCEAHIPIQLSPWVRVSSDVSRCHIGPYKVSIVICQEVIGERCQPSTP